MMTQVAIGTRQIEIRKRLNERGRLAGKLKIVEEQIAEHEEQILALEESLSKEQLDLHKMDSFSLVNVYRKWKGTHHELREKEYEEAAKAELKLNEHEHMLRDLRKDEDQIRKSLLQYAGVDEEWDDFLQEKKVWLRVHNDEVTSELDYHLGQYTELEALLVEMDEAIEAGSKASTSLGRALDKLKSAKTMSTWDTFFGGGLIVTAMKHGELNESENALHSAQLNLRRFEAELADVRESSTGGLQVERGSFVTFADYFFDDIFSEWTIHSRINTSIDNVEAMKTKVSNMVTELKTRKEEVTARKAEVWQRYELEIERG